MLTEDYWLLFCIILASYAIGSVPFGYLFAKFSGLGDIRTVGSGNIGATNVLRAGKKGVALATLIADVLKGFAPVYLAILLYNQGILPDIAPIVAIMATVIGHCFPIWLKFKGGKGVATSLGAILAVSPLLALILMVVWLSIFIISRISSLAALVAALAAPIASFFLESTSMTVVCVLLMALLWLNHANNIIRIINGEEKTIKF